MNYQEELLKRLKPIKDEHHSIPKNDSEIDIKLFLKILNATNTTENIKITFPPIQTSPAIKELF